MKYLELTPEDIFQEGDEIHQLCVDKVTWKLVDRGWKKIEDLAPYFIGTPVGGDGSTKVRRPLPNSVHFIKEEI